MRVVNSFPALSDQFSPGGHVQLYPGGDSGDEPYIVTLSYGFDQTEQSLYFHTAPVGLKLDFIRANPRVCATVIEDGGYIATQCAHAYRSVVIWGRMSVIEGLPGKKKAMEKLLTHLESDSDQIRRKNLEQDAVYDRVTLLRLEIESITGKKGK